jgi:carbamoyl-phosphate synthase large subunit
MVVIEMNPRVSRSSALASKATGFPIAKVAAKLAIGLHAGRAAQRHHRRIDPGLVRAGDRLCGHQDSALHLREVPRANDRLTTQMKSVGEVMAIGRTFQESLHKALRGLEVGVTGFRPEARPRRPGMPWTVAPAS